MSLQFTINLDFLQSIDPPSSYPPAQQQIYMQIQNKFLSQCQRFISNEKILYKCSKSIQTKLKSILLSSQDIKQKLEGQKDRLDVMAHELSRFKDQERRLRDRQRILKLFCDLIKMEEIRKDLLLGESSGSRREENEVKLADGNANVSEVDYLRKVYNLWTIIQQSKNLVFLGNQFMLIKEIFHELQAIYVLAVKFIIKQLLTPKMISLILNQYHHIFLRESSASYKDMHHALINHRVQHIKISLNPMINNLNYATNFPQLYSSILSTWATLLKEELALFSCSKRYDIVKSINNSVFPEIFLRMQKNIFRIKDLMGVIKIRKFYYDFWLKLRQCAQLYEGKNNGEHMVMISGLLNKCELIIGSKLTQQSQLLEASKYNIHSMTSYIPIREHLQKIKLAYQFSIDSEDLDWQIGFYNLCTSRDPKNYPNNKSLIIFNLNIWYLYLKILPRGKHRSEGQQTIQWCLNTFASINIQEINKKYYQSFDKVLEIGGNVPAFKASLYSEIHLLGHDELRREVAKMIRNKYIEFYEKILLKIEGKPMNNEEVKAFCQSRKINLNKFGKFSHSICIYSKSDLYELLEYK